MNRLGAAYPSSRAVIAAALVVAAFVPLNYALQLWLDWSALWPARVWLLGDNPDSGDSWHVMAAALDFVRAHPEAPLYQNVFFEQQLKFQYAPSSFLPLEALQAVGVDTNPAFMNGLNRVLILATAAGMGLFAWRGFTLFRSAPLDADARAARWMLAALAACATLTFYPVMMAYKLGQLQVWINAVFVFAALAWLGDRRALAGVLIGLICLLKPQFGLFALWGLLRRDMRFTLALCLTGALGLGLSVLLYGLANHLDYLSVLQFLSRHGESYLANQSVNGLLHRLVGAGGHGEFEPNSFPPFHPLVYAGTLAATLALVAAALFLPRGRGAQAGLWDFLFAALAFTVASPIAWEHHYGVIAPAFAALLCAYAATPRSGAGRSWPALAACFALAANCLTFTRLIDAPPLNVLQSYLLFAALGVLALLWRERQLKLA